MKNLNLTFVAIIFALFALTSCEKEGMQEMTQTSGSEIMERKLPAEGIHTVNESAQTLATQASLSETASSRTIGFERITDFSRAIHRTTIGQGNSLDYRNAPCLDSYGDRFDGPDAGFYFEVDFDPSFLPDVEITYEVILSNLRADLDLFVYTVDQGGYIDQCKGKAMSHGYGNEVIQLGELNKGIYVIMVDGWAADIACDFTLKVEKKVKNTFTPGPGDGNEGPGPINPGNGGAQSMDNARFIDFLGGDAGLTGNGWMVTRNGESQIFDNYEATATVLTLMSYEVVNGKEIETTITFNKSTKWVTSETKWKKQYSSGSSSWSASIRDIEYGN